MSPEAAFPLIRCVHFGAIVLLLGTVVFRRRLAVPEVAVVLAATWHRWEVWAAAAALGSAIAWLLAETAVAADGWVSALDPDTVWSMASDTAFGGVWTGRIVLIAGLLALAAAKRASAALALEIGAAVLVTSLGWVGHGAMLEGGAGFLLSAGLGLHVLAAATWVGALPAVLLCLRASGTRYPLAAAAGSLDRFSKAGQVAVATVVVSGLLVTRTILGDWPLTIATGYRELLAIKIFLVSVMIGLALANRYVLTPQFEKGSGPAAQVLIFSVGLEILLTGLVLALVATFGSRSPME